MLLELRISNFIIIEDLSIEFDEGFNVLSGETGAGKSILIDAISGILGDKISSDTIRSGKEKAILEGIFDIKNLSIVKEVLNDAGIDYDDDILIIRREIQKSRSKFFANSIQITSSKVKEISENLLNIHGQNEHQNIIKPAKHREILDNFGEIQEEVNFVTLTYNTLTEVKNSLNSFNMSEREKDRIIEFNTHEINEIDSAELENDEEEKLLAESKLLSNAEKLSKDIHICNNIINNDEGALSLLKKCELSLESISQFDSKALPILEEIRNAICSTEEVSSFVNNYSDNFSFSLDRLNEVEERLSKISSFKKKFKCNSIKEILEYRDKIQKELDELTSSEEEIERLTERKNELLNTLKESSIALSNKRKECALNLEQKLMKELEELGMQGTEFKVDIQLNEKEKGDIIIDDKKVGITPYGIDKIEFFMSANRGEELRELRKVASGGEMSRIMLALKNVLLSADIVESLIFDEVDTGISGPTAEIVGEKLKQLSFNKQVLVITHLAQIASMSDCHFLVVKETLDDRTETYVKKLSKDDKVLEIARLLAGKEVTNITMEHAKELVNKTNF
jgi:DNA repair protein RecN (Recombination protein N)